MVISTAAVHSGASGGALLDAAGRLVGLVTSNARHVKGQTLPHLNFCISAAELRPVWEWAQQQQARDGWMQQGPAAQATALDRMQQQQQQQELRRFDVATVAGTKLWALQPYLHTAATGPIVSSL
jgi:S1-C subfamily serine protease